VNELDWMQDAALGLRAEIEQECDAAPGRPDLADVLARARAIDSRAVPVGLVAVDDLEDVAEDDVIDPELAVFAEAFRDEVESDVAERTLHPATPPAASSGRRRVVVAVAAIAAVLLAVVGLSAFTPDVARIDAERGPASMAAKTVETLAEDGAWTRTEAPTETPQVETRPPRPRTPNVDATPEPEAVEAVTPEPLAAPLAARKPRQPRVSLDELETQAMAAWKADELAKAEGLFRKIIARAGRSSRAELAYADLFALAKQRGGASAQAKAWRQYLRTFPQGRHADDARAGLCMRASGEAATKCWSNYLDAHPKGAHASRAQRAIE
jgi:hypothetical protein